MVEQDGVVVGYGSIEEPPADPAGTHRLFLVLRWPEPSAVAIADALLSRLRTDISDIKPAEVFFREYADDGPFIKFLKARGFEVKEVYDYEGLKLVNLVPHHP